MKIDKIIKMKSGKYKLILDNQEKIVTYDDVILKHKLLFNKDIDSEQMNDLNIDTKYYDSYHKLLKFLTTKMHSEKELKEYLDRINATDEEKITLINKFKDIGLINDLSFTKAYISDKINLSNIGPLKIKTELLNHDIPIEIIEEEVNKIDSQLIVEKLNKIINKKVKNNHKYSNYIFRQKTYNELIDLGYENDMINDCLNFFTIDNNNIANEYNRLYQKLSKKYDGEKLSYYLKQKLYQKGFSMDEINKLLNE